MLSEQAFGLVSEIFLFARPESAVFTVKTGCDALPAFTSRLSGKVRRQGPLLPGWGQATLRGAYLGEEGEGGGGRMGGL